MGEIRCQCCAKVAELVGLEPNAGYDTIEERVRNVVLIAAKVMEPCVRMPTGATQLGATGTTGCPTGAHGQTGPREDDSGKEG